MKVILLMVSLAIGGTMAAYRKRSLGGIPTPIEQAPFFVLITRDVQDYCGGAFITTKHVLTAAHCIVDKSYARYPNLAVVSSTDETYVGGTLHHVHDIVTPLQYNPQDNRNDIGVIILSEHVKWNIQKNFVALPIQEPKYHGNGTLIALDSTEESNDLSLRQLEVKMYPHDVCLQFLPIDEISYYANSFCGIVGDGQSIQKMFLPKRFNVSEESIKDNKYYIWYYNTRGYKEFLPIKMKGDKGKYYLQADDVNSLLYLWIINIRAIVVAHLFIGGESWEHSRIVLNSTIESAFLRMSINFYPLSLKRRKSRSSRIIL